MEIPSHSYGVSLAVWDHTVLVHKITTQEEPAYIILSVTSFSIEIITKLTNYDLHMHLNIICVKLHNKIKTYKPKKWTFHFLNVFNVSIFQPGF